MSEKVSRVLFQNPIHMEVSNLSALLQSFQFPRDSTVEEIAKLKLGELTISPNFDDELPHHDPDHRVIHIPTPLNDRRISAELHILTDLSHFLYHCSGSSFGYWIGGIEGGFTYLEGISRECYQACLAGDVTIRYDVRRSEWQVISNNGTH